MDIRILLEPYEQEEGQNIISQDCLQWAFAGKSQMTNTKKNEDGDTVFWHGTWDHWIDSKSNNPEGDEGDMTVREDSTVLEEGASIDALTGAPVRYEELWEDLPVDQIGKKGNRSSIVLRVDDSVKNIKGLLVKVGSWCQGIVKNGGGLTVERWQRQPKEENGHDRLTTGWDESTRTHNDWVRLFKIGSGFIPSSAVLSETKGKLGLHAQVKAQDGIEWNVVEEYYY